MMKRIKAFIFPFVFWSYGGDCRNGFWIVDLLAKHCWADKRWPVFSGSFHNITRICYCFFWGVFLFVCVHYFPYENNIAQTLSTMESSDFSLCLYGIGSINCEFPEIHGLSSWLTCFFFCLLIKQHKEKNEQRNSTIWLKVETESFHCKYHSFWWISCYKLFFSSMWSDQ